MANSLPLNNSIFFELVLTNPEVSPPDVNDASVIVTLTDPDGNPVAGQTWPMTLPPVGEGGVYRKTVPPISGLIAGTNYKATYNVVGADGLIGEFCAEVKAKGC